MAGPFSALLPVLISSLVGAGSQAIQGRRARKLNQRLAEQSAEQTERLATQRLAQEEELANLSRVQQRELAEQGLAQTEKLEAERLSRQSQLERQRAIEARTSQLTERKTKRTASRQSRARADQIRARRLGASNIESRPLESFTDITSSVLDEGRRG